MKAQGTKNQNCIDNGETCDYGYGAYDEEKACLNHRVCHSSECMFGGNTSDYCVHAHHKEDFTSPVCRAEGYIDNDPILTDLVRQSHNHSNPKPYIGSSQQAPHQLESTQHRAQQKISNNFGNKSIYDWPNIVNPDYFYLDPRRLDEANCDMCKWEKALPNPIDVQRAHELDTYLRRKQMEIVDFNRPPEIEESVKSFFNAI